jgi:CBS domain-containing protein
MAIASQLLKHKGRLIYSVTPEAPVLEAIRLMAEHGVGALLVMQGEKLIGVVSERDYARKVILKGRSSNETPVSQIMSSPVLTVHAEQSVHDCMRIMSENRIRQSGSFRETTHDPLSSNCEYRAGQSDRIDSVRP